MVAGLVEDNNKQQITVTILFNLYYHLFIALYICTFVLALSAGVRCLNVTD